MIADTAIAYLVETGKDLEPMAMMIEASARLDRIDGLDRAINVMADLIETYWEQGLYPQEDEDEGVEARFQPLSGLSGGGSDKDGTLIDAAAADGAGRRRRHRRAALSSIASSPTPSSPTPPTPRPTRCARRCCRRPRRR